MPQGVTPSRRRGRGVGLVWHEHGVHDRDIRCDALIEEVREVVEQLCAAVSGGKQRRGDQPRADDARRPYGSGVRDHVFGVEGVPVGHGFNDYGPIVGEGVIGHGREGMLGFGEI